MAPDVRPVVEAHQVAEHGTWHHGVEAVLVDVDAHGKWLDEAIAVPVHRSTTRYRSRDATATVVSDRNVARSVGQSACTGGNSHALQQQVLVERPRVRGRVVH